jgi:hypothetical protein
MACVFMGGWVRGHAIEDIIQFGNGDDTVQHILKLSHHGIRWNRIEAFGGTRLGWTPGWGIEPIKSTVHTGDPKVIGEAKWRWVWCGFDFCDSANDSDVQSRSRIIPYWSLVLPLTLLSAWLILIKPRKAKGSP